MIIIRTTIIMLKFIKDFNSMNYFRYYYLIVIRINLEVQIITMIIIYRQELFVILILTLVKISFYMVNFNLILKNCDNLLFQEELLFVIEVFPLVNSVWHLLL